MKHAPIFLALLFFVTLTSSLDAQMSFTPIGFLEGGNFTGPWGISNDGKVVGTGGSTSGDQAFFWSGSTGIIALGDLDGGTFRSLGHSISNDGLTITVSGNSTLGREAATWTASGGFVGYGDLAGGSYESAFIASSSDGSVLAGFGNSAAGEEAMYWTQSTGMVGIGDLDGGTVGSNARGISSDGTTIVGWSNAAGKEAMYWTQPTGMVGIGDLAGGITESQANDVSANGSVIVGWGNSDGGREAMYWTQATGMVGLGDLDGGNFRSVARSVSDDGLIIVGWGSTDIGQQAMIWDEENGMRILQDVLLANGVTNLAGWQLTDARSISGDGQFITGQGINPDGKNEGWVVRLDAPLETSDRLAIADDGNDRVYDYDSIDGSSLGDMPLASGNNAPRGVASDSEGNTWYIDNDDYVYVYDAAGDYLGKWKAMGLRYPEGIAVAGDDVLIVDRGYDKVFVYEGGANWLDNANHYPSDSWSLNYRKGNRSPRGIATDGSTVWVVNSARTDRIYQYSIGGAYQGRYNLDAGANNRNPRGIAINADGSELSVVDISSRRVFAYDVNNIGGGALGWFSLAPTNTNPQGIAEVVSD